jgi:hypothetical protein
MDILFQGFPKIPRLSREIVITEKIDGTNAQIFIYESEGELKLLAGSRTRWIYSTKGLDNHGFARWVEANTEDLKRLGPGHHFGEWWGSGINKRYIGVKDKYFSLFNTDRWSDPEIRPKCCGIVPVLYRGPFDTSRINEVLEDLKFYGSQVFPFEGDRETNPRSEAEGVVVYHTGANTYFKKTLLGDEIPKTLQGARP